MTREKHTREGVCRLCDFERRTRARADADATIDRSVGRSIASPSWQSVIQSWCANARASDRLNKEESE